MDAAVSPDSSTFYVAYGLNPNVALSYVDADTLEVKQTVAFDSVSVDFGLAISADGSQFYVPGHANFQGTDIFRLNVATEALMAVPAVVNGNVAVSPGGTVYIGAGSEVVVFDPASQKVAETGAPPSQNIAANAATGSLTGAAYDSTNHLLLAADAAKNIEVLDASTLQPAGQIFIPNLAYSLLTAGVVPDLPPVRHQGL